MDQLKNDVKLLQYWMCETRRDINTVRKDIMMQGMCKEGFKQLIEKVTRLEKHVDVMAAQRQEGVEQLVERVVGLEKHVDVMAARLNDAIEKFNTFHKLLEKKHIKDEYDLMMKR